MVMADSLSAQSVGREFVKQYYTMMNQAPNYLHRFYSNNSSFVHSSVDQPGDDQPIIVGQQEIHKKIMSLNYRDCHAKIRQVDSQASVADGVIIQVIGELSNEGGPLCPFVQTFVLVAQSPRKYYVHNDIFRYLGSVISEKTYSTAEPIHTVDSTFIDGQCNGREPTAEELTPTYYVLQSPPLQQQPLSNGVSHVESEPEVVQAEFVNTAVDQSFVHPSSDHPDQSEDSEMVVDAVKVEPEEPVKVEVVEPKKEIQEETHVESKIEVETPVITEPKIVKPVTWAAMASKTPVSGASQARPPQQHRATRPQPNASRQTVEVSEPSQTSPVALPQRSPRQNNSQQNTNQEPTPDPDSNKVQAPETDESRRPQIAQHNYPDCQQVFVGNLPQYLSDMDLREFFSQYGEVVEMKINRKNGNVNNLPYFGFVVFDSAETVQKVLTNRPLFLNGSNGKHRINVEEKKPRAELQASRPRSASRGGGRPSGPYGRGSDSYNRGGPRPGGAPSAASSSTGENVRNSSVDEGNTGVSH